MADSLQENGALQLQLHPEPFDPLVVLADWQRSLAAGGTEPAAAEAHFIGRVRGITAAGAPLEALELEHYAGCPGLSWMDWAGLGWVRSLG